MICSLYQEILTFHIIDHFAKVGLGSKYHPEASYSHTKSHNHVTISAKSFIILVFRLNNPGKTDIPAETSAERCSVGRELDRTAAMNHGSKPVFFTNSFLSIDPVRVIIKYSRIKRKEQWQKFFL